MIIDDKEYKRLLESAKTLECLEAGGVDNWDGYDSSLEPLRKEQAEKELWEDLAGEIIDAISEYICEPAGVGCGYGVNCKDETYNEIASIIKKRCVLKESP